MNNKIKLVNHRAFGFRSVRNFVAPLPLLCSVAAARGALIALSGGERKMRTLRGRRPDADSPKSSSPSAPAHSSFYRPELDFLRFFAFLAVFIHHSVPHAPDVFEAHGIPRSLASWVAAAPLSGAYGVDLFFVLSAYLITELLQREFAITGRLDIRSFYIRRILRIWPLYFFFLAVCIVLSAFRIPGQHFGVMYVLAFVLLAGNWVCAFKGYPGSAAAPLWSVSLEEQFYLAWPALMRLIKVKRLMTAALGMIAVAFASRLILLHVGIQHLGVWCNTLARLDPIACGIILAVWLKSRRPMLPITLRAALAVLSASIWLVVVRWAPLHGLLPVSLFVGYPAIAVASSLAVVVMLACDVSKLPKWISSSGVYLGRISYGLYVFHVLAINMVNAVNRASFAMRWLASLIITVILSAISYRFLEQPFLRLKLKYTHVLSRPGG